MGLDIYRQCFSSHTLPPNSTATNRRPRRVFNSASIMRKSLITLPMAVDRSMQVEGIFTVACGLLGFFVVPSTPAATRLLSPDQKE